MCTFIQFSWVLISTLHSCGHFSNHLDDVLWGRVGCVTARQRLTYLFSPKQSGYRAVPHNKARYHTYNADTILWSNVFGLRRSVIQGVLCPRECSSSIKLFQCTPWSVSPESIRHIIRTYINRVYRCLYARCKTKRRNDTYWLTN
jgi:hypothetical protein